MRSWQEIMDSSMDVHNFKIQTTKPLVSIIVPVFNRKQEILNLIENLNEQTFKNFEVIFIDDHSKEPLSVLFNSKIKTDFRYLILRNHENKGVSFSRNRGVQNSSGHYIAFLDSDDAWYPNKLAECVIKCENREEEIFCLAKTRIVKQTYEEYLPLESPEVFNSGEEYLFFNGLFAQVSSFFLSSSLAKKLQFNESLTQYEDYLYFIQAFNNAERVAFIDQTLVTWFDDKTDGRLSTNKSYKQAQTFIQLINNEIDDQAIAAFYLRFVLPYYFYSDIKISILSIYKCLTSGKVPLKAVVWMTAKGILGNRIITKLRGAIKK